MSYHEQRDRWIRAHPEATVEEAWNAVYMTSTENWCKIKR